MTTRPPEPPRRCPRHVDDPPYRACGDCIDAEQYHREWEQRTARADAEAASLHARTQADLKRAEIARCGLCDDRGYQGPALCRHDPDAPARAARGAQACRDALATSQSGGPTA